LLLLKFVFDERKNMTGKITRSTDPEVLEFPFEQLTAYTPNELFYVRNHFPPPDIDVKTWFLAVEGTVKSSLKLSFEDILAMPSRSVSMTLECAGNSRTFLVPAVKGVQWDLGGISSAEWTGVALADVIERAGINAETVDLMFEGGDVGLAPEEPKPIGSIHFARSLPLKKALDKSVLLAYEMNGERLTSAHGFPLRLIVPGWYAVASVKWLKRIVALDHVFQGYFQTIDYGYWDKSNGEPERKPITEMLVKAQIAHPQLHDTVPKDSKYVVSGAAWSGAGKVVGVELSTDGGASWHGAEISSESSVGMWCLWHYDWQTPKVAGEVVLLARATDEKGNTQAFVHDPDRDNYMINFCLPIPVQVQ
jgi:DMSO/TMAO reductase YedYZ molybdopterin-dependent catalytic subunit